MEGGKYLALRGDGKFQTQRRGLQEVGEAQEEGISPTVRDLLPCPRAIYPRPLWGHIAFPCLKFQFN